MARLMPERPDDLAALLPPVEVVDGLPATALPAFLAALAGLQTRVASRLAVERTPDTPTLPASPSTGRLLTVPEAAERIGMAPDWIYRHAKSLPFIRRLGRAVKVDEAHLARWLASRPR